MNILFAIALWVHLFNLTWSFCSANTSAPSV